MLTALCLDYYVELMFSTNTNGSVGQALDGQTKQLECRGYSTPRGKITWYRYYNNSGCLRALDIHGYWSFIYHYNIKSTSDNQGIIDSTLTIDRFSKSYGGLYYCVVYIGDGSAAVQSPVMNLTYGK